MKKSFEYDLTKYDPSAPKKTEEFLTADGVKTLTTDANDGAVLIQDEVDEDSLNPVTGAAVAAAIEAGGGGGGSYTAGDGIAISEGEISAKVDGTTIQVNADGELEAIGGGTEEVFIAKYNTTTWEAVLEAYNDGKVIFLEVTDTSIPYPYRMNSTAQIPLAAIRTGATGKCAVFIGSSLGSPDGTGENTSWNVYILGNNDSWSTQAGKIYPSFTASDFNKVLSIVDNGNNFPVLQWTTPQGGSYTAGDGIDITNSKIKVDLATNKGLEFASSTETTFTADYQGYDLGQWGYMGIGPLHKTSDGLFYQLDFRPMSGNYLAWNVNNGNEYYLFAYDPQDTTKYATCGVAYYADINEPTLVAIGGAYGTGQYNHFYTADTGNWNFSGGLDPADLDNAAFGIYFPNTSGSSPMGTDYAAVDVNLLQNIGYSTTTPVADTGKLQVKVNENTGLHVDGSGISINFDGSTIGVNDDGQLCNRVSPYLPYGYFAPFYDSSLETLDTNIVNAYGTYILAELTDLAQVHWEPYAVSHLSVHVPVVSAPAGDVYKATLSIVLSDDTDTDTLFLVKDATASYNGAASTPPNYGATDISFEFTIGPRQLPSDFHISEMTVRIEDATNSSQTMNLPSWIDMSNERRERWVRDTAGATLTVLPVALTNA